MKFLNRCIASFLSMVMVMSIAPTEIFATSTYNFFGSMTGYQNAQGQSNWLGGIVSETDGDLSPAFRVTLSRQQENYLDGTEATWNNMYKYYSSAWPTTQDAESSSMFFIENTTYSKMQSKVDVGGYNNGTNIGLGSYTPGFLDIQWSSTDEIGDLIFQLSATSVEPTNTFLVNVMNDYNSKLISDMKDLNDLYWTNYLPTQAEADAFINYIFTSTGSGEYAVQSRMENFVSGIYNIGSNGPYVDSNLNEMAPTEMTPKEKFVAAAAYGGLLACFYVKALDESDPTVRSLLVASYESAINDYFSSENTEEKPVSLVLDTALNFTFDSTEKKVFVIPTIDYVQYGYLTQADFSLTMVGTTEYLTEQYPEAVGSSKQLINYMAAESVALRPTSTTYVETGNSPIRNYDKGGKMANISYNPFLWGQTFSQFGKTGTDTYSDGVLGSTYGLTRIISGSDNPYSGVEQKSYGLYGPWTVFELDDSDDGIKGFYISSKHIGTPTPGLTYNVDPTLETVGDSCSEMVTPSQPAVLKFQFNGDSSLLSAVLGRIDDEDFEGATLDVEIIREAGYTETYTSDDVTSSYGVVTTQMTEMEDDLKGTYEGDALINLVSGEPIQVNDYSVMTDNLEKLKSGSRTYRYTYIMTATLKLDAIDDALIETYPELAEHQLADGSYYFSMEDMVEKKITEEGITYVNFADVLVPPLIDSLTIPDDIVIQPASKTPSADENLTENTQMIKRYSFTSSGEEFAEIKSNAVNDEEYEVMAGIPSSEELYFSVGGSEFKVAMVAQYWMNEHSRDRTYTVHFGEVLCEYNNETGSGTTSIDPGEGIGDRMGTRDYIVQPESGNSQSMDTEDCTISCNNADGSGDGDWVVVTVWEGQNPCEAITSPCSNCGATINRNHELDTSPYDETIIVAQAWADAMGAEIVTHTSGSDEVTRVTNWVPVVDIVTDDDDQTKPGDDGSSGCGGGHSCGYSGDGDHSCDTTGCTGGTACTNDHYWTITVTCTIKPHEVCGPCCGHQLPDLFDTWRQGLVYDFVKISQVRIFKLDQGSVDGMTELVGTDTVFASVMSGNPTYYMNIAQFTQQTDESSNGLGGSGNILTNMDGNSPTYNPYAVQIDSMSYTIYSGKNRVFSQSSLAGRLRYVLADNQEDFSVDYDEQGDATGGSFDMIATEIASSVQHDDVVYYIGERSRNCDGMATTNNFGKSSSNNVVPMNTTGHVNEWADGSLYTNTPTYHDDDYEWFYNSGEITTDSLSSCVRGFDPQRLKDNEKDENGNTLTDITGYEDALYFTYEEDYDHHLSNEDWEVDDSEDEKTKYSDFSDATDRNTAEWQVMDAARNVEVVAHVISDFLILQTSGGDQSLFYYETATDPTPTQEHFQKVAVSIEEIMTDNPLSIFQGTLSCSGGDTQLKADYIDVEDSIIIGGYNGQYSGVDSGTTQNDKYKPYSLVTNQFYGYNTEGNTGGLEVYNATNKTGQYYYTGGSVIETIFDDDPALSLYRPAKTSTGSGTHGGFVIAQENMQILPTATNKLYEPYNALVWYPQMIAYYSIDANVIDNPEGDTTINTWGNVNIGYKQKLEYGETYYERWGSSTGVDYKTKYYLTPASSDSDMSGAEDDSKTVNQVIVYTPSSVEDAIVLPQEDIVSSGVTIPRDQRVEGFDFSDMNELVNAAKVCPLDPAECEYRILDCKYLEPTEMAYFDFDSTNVVDGVTYVLNTVTNMEYPLPDGFKVENGKLVATGTEGAGWVLPFSELGLSNINSNMLSINMDISNIGSYDDIMLVGFNEYGFTLDSGGSGGSFIQTSGTFMEKISYTSVLDRFAYKTSIASGSTSYMDTIGVQGVTDSTLSGSLALTFSFNNIIDSTVNGSGTTVSELTEEWIDTTDSEGNATRTQQIYMKAFSVTDEEDYDGTTIPTGLSTGDIGTNLIIGSWASSDAYRGSYTIDNLQIVLEGGTLSHTSLCYKEVDVHSTSMTHTHTADCYLDEDMYVCEGTFNANYVHGDAYPLNYFSCDGKDNAHTCNDSCYSYTASSATYDSVDEDGGGDSESGSFVAVTAGTITVTATGSATYKATVTVNGSTVISKSTSSTFTTSASYSAGDTVYYYINLDASRNFNLIGYKDALLKVSWTSGSLGYASANSYHTSGTINSHVCSGVNHAYSNGCYTVGSHKCYGTSGTNTANGCYTTGTEHIHNYNVTASTWSCTSTATSHSHSVSSCYKVTTASVTCDFLPKGTLLCNNELNTLTDYNAHVHTKNCLNYVETVDIQDFTYTGLIQEFTVPYSDTYIISAWGPGTSSNLTGYAQVEVYLTVDTVLYISFMEDGSLTTVRSSTTGYDADTEMSYNYDEVDKSSYALIEAGTTADSVYVGSNVGYGLVVNYTGWMGSVDSDNQNGKGYVSIECKNETIPSSTVLQGILDGLYTEEEVIEYLGEELAGMVYDTIGTMYTYIGFDYLTPQGITGGEKYNAFTFVSNEILSYIDADVPEFYIETDIQGETVRRIDIMLDNNSSATTLEIIPNGNSDYAVSSTMLANTEGQTISVVTTSWSGLDISTLEFDISKGTTSGTTSVSSIALMGFGPVVTGPVQTNTSLVNMNTFTTDNNYGFTSRNNCSVVTSNGTMTITTTGADPQTEWTTLDSIAADGLDYIKITFENTSGNADTGQLFFSKNGTYVADQSIGWDVGTVSGVQTVYIQMDTLSSYNATTGVFKDSQDTATWSGTITDMRFDWTMDGTSGNIMKVYSIELIGPGAASGTGAYEYTMEQLYASGKVLLNKTTSGTSNITLPAGSYTLEVVGASGYNGGGGSSSYPGGDGGKATATLTLTESTKLYYYVGGQGSGTTGGYNGGADSKSYGGGGGASHISLATGLLSSYTLTTAKVSVLLVGGGGGGGGHTGYGGDGGGTSGSDGQSSSGTYGIGGTQTSAGYNAGFGYGGTDYRHGGGGGGGWYGGAGGGNDCSDGGGGGSGYTSALFTSGSVVLSGTSMTTGYNTGAGYIKITTSGIIYEETLTESPVTITSKTIDKLVIDSYDVFELNDSVLRTIIEENVSLIPTYAFGDLNTIFGCKFLEYNTHVHDSGCYTSYFLDCSEPHHKGSHYGTSSLICWEACCDDSNHVSTVSEVLIGDDIVMLADYLQIDDGFTIYFPNVGDFMGNNALGLAYTQEQPGYGYTDNMDTTDWTREKRVKFPFDVIYEDEVRAANVWIDLYVPQEFFEFYLPVSNNEASNVPVAFEAEAINCGTASGLEPVVGITYTDTAMLDYETSIESYISNYFTDLYVCINAGYVIPNAFTYSGSLYYGQNDSFNKQEGTMYLHYSNFGYLKFFFEKQSSWEKDMRTAMQQINDTIDLQFDGAYGLDTPTAEKNENIKPHALEYAGMDLVDEKYNPMNTINSKVKGRTVNDNYEDVSNYLRRPSLESLHGAYKEFYIDVIGRIGNFSIVDTEDFRFSNFFKTSIFELDDTLDTSDPNNWVVEGLVPVVDDSVQNYYVGDIFDLRGIEAEEVEDEDGNVKLLNTWGLQTWKEDGLVGQILTADLNNIDELKGEELRYGYDVYTTIETIGNYGSGQISVIPKYYALKVNDNYTVYEEETGVTVEKGEFVPVSVYMDKDGVYVPVNIYDNISVGGSVVGDVSMYDYAFNLDWTSEGDRRNYTWDEKYITDIVCDFYESPVYDYASKYNMLDEEFYNFAGFDNEQYLSDGVTFNPDYLEKGLFDDLAITDVVLYGRPDGKNNYMGTAQFLVLTSAHRTFIGTTDTFGPTTDKDYGGSTWDADEVGDDKDPGDVIGEIYFMESVQRWHGKLGVPSSAVFVPHDEDKDDGLKLSNGEVTVDSDTVEYVMNDDYVIVCTADIVATGSVWNLGYSQPWFTELTLSLTDEVTGELVSTTFDIPGGYPGSGAIGGIPPVIAVYSSANSSIEDIEIVSTH